MQGGGGLPGLVAHPGHEFSDIACWSKGNPAAVAGDRITVRSETGGFRLQPLDRGIDEADGSADRAFFAHDVPGLERQAQLDLHPRSLEFPEQGEAELEMRGEPVRAQREARSRLFCVLV